jgi:hypothetical protein
MARGISTHILFGGLAFFVIHELIIMIS